MVHVIKIKCDWKLKVHFHKKQCNLPFLSLFSKQQLGLDLNWWKIEERGGHKYLALSPPKKPALQKPSSLNK